MILTIFIVSLFVISTVNAADNVTRDVVGLEETINDVISVENYNQVVANENDVGSFDDLKTEIENVDEGGVLTLTKDYKYVNGSTNGISISKSITIDGKGHTLDGSHLSRIFKIDKDNVYLKNIKFVNGDASHDWEWMTYGGAIFNTNSNGSAVNCSFINNTGYHGGAIHINWGDTTYFPCINCTFINNSHCALKGGSAVNCTFINNFNDDIYSYGGAMCGVSAVNCTFINNSASEDGGALWGGSAVNCTFINNYANHFGGSIYVTDDNTVIVNCTFMDSSALEKGGAIYSSKTNLLINNCSFINSFAESGDSIYMMSGVLNNSYFENDDDNSYIFKNVNFIKKVPKLTLSDATFDYNNISDYNISLKSNGVILNYKKIYLELSKGDYIVNYEFTTSERGIINLLPLLKNLDVGTWNIKASFLGTVNYEKVSKTSKITINPTESPNSDDVLIIIQNLNKTIQSQDNLIAELNSTINNLNATVQSQTGLIDSLNVTVNNQSSIIDKLNADVESQNNLINEFNKTIVNQNGVIDELNSTVQSQKDLINTLNVTVINQNNVIDMLNLTIKSQNDLIYEINQTVINSSEFNETVINDIIGVLNKTIINQNGVIAELNSTVNSQSDLINGLNVTVINQNNVIDMLNLTIKSQNDLINEINQTLIYQNGVIDEFNGTIHSQAGLIANLNQTISNKNVVIDELNATIKSQNNLINVLNETIINQNDDIVKLNGTVHSQTGLIDSLNLTVDGQNGFIADLNGTVCSQAGLISSLNQTINNQNAVIVELNNTVNDQINSINTLNDLIDNLNQTVSMKPMRNITMDVSSVTTVYNGGKYLIVTLTDSEYRTLVGAPLTVTLNGKINNYTTDIYGQIKISTNDLAPNTYSTTIAFIGDDSYVSSSKTVAVVINKATPIVSAPTATFKVSVKTKSYSIILKNNKNEVMKNAYVSFKVNGKTYYEKTNAKGQATFKITNLNKKGTFTAEVKYDGNSYYNAVTVKPKITVK